MGVLLAAGNPDIDLLGITTVSGNHNVENTPRNALSVCTAYGIEVPVAKGSPGPLLIDQVLAVEIHGETSTAPSCRPPRSNSTGGMPSTSSSTRSWRMSSQMLFGLSTSGDKSVVRDIRVVVHVALR